MKKKKISLDKKFESLVGKPTGDKDKLLHAAAKDILAGAKSNDVSVKYALDAQEVNAYLKRVFPTDEEKYEFMENVMISNSMRAMNIFEKTHKEMTAIDAAKAAGLFAGKALEIKKAKEMGFKEAPTNPQTILNLEKVLINIISTK